MATDFPMPKLGLTMEEGTIIEWLVPTAPRSTAGTAGDGDRDRQDRDRGRGQRQRPRCTSVGAVGETFPCGAVIGWSSPTARPGARRLPCRRRRRPPSRPRRRRRRPSAPRQPVPANGGRRFVSPNAGGSPPSCGVDLAAVRGTGPGGRIVSADVESAHLAGRRSCRGSDRRTQPRRAARHERRRRRRRRGSSPTCSAIDLGAVDAGPDRRLRHPRGGRTARPRLRLPRRRATPASTPAAQTPTETGPTDAGCAARSPSACTPRCSRWRS